MKISPEIKGDVYIIAEAVLWSLFPIITILTYAKLTSLSTLAWSTMLSTVFFGVLLVAKGKLHELKNVKVYKYALGTAFFIGWLFYGFYSTGLKFTSAGNASIIALMELFFSYILFNVWKKEELTKEHTWGAVLMLLGAVIILYPKQGFSLHGGDLMVLIASACSPMGNYFQQKARKMVSAVTLLFLRSIFTFPFFFILAYFLHAQSSLQNVQSAIWILIFNGIFLLGLSKIWWIEGINLISVTKANALASISPLFTLIFAYFLLHQSPNVWQLFALVPLVIGLRLLTNKSKIQKPLD